MAAVIDTNVILVANGSHAEVCPDCVIACLDRLELIRRNGPVVIDDSYRILNEYQNKTLPRIEKRVGDAFVKWLLQNSANAAHVQKVKITETQQDTFAEFPDAELQQAMDPADRKFVAVAASHPDRPPIMQASDCKWLDCCASLREHAIAVDFLCPADVQAFYRAKFPGKPVPPI